MSSTVNRPPVDIAPRQARPSLALVLALLAVPGSTIAWELPAGGFWIGLPLAIAAIAFGMKSRGSKMALAAIVIAGLCIAMMTVWTLVELLG